MEVDILYNHRSNLISIYVLYEDYIDILVKGVVNNSIYLDDIVLVDDNDHDLNNFYNPSFYDVNVSYDDNFHVILVKKVEAVEVFY